MIRGADTQYIFDLPCSCSDVQSAKVTFWQPENLGTEFSPLPIVKMVDLSNSTDDKQLHVTLVSAETRRFSDKRKAYAQMVITKNNGVCIPSKQEMITVYPARDELFENTTDNDTGNGGEN